MKEYLVHVEGVVPLSTFRLRSEVDEAQRTAKICLSINPPSLEERKQLQIVLSCVKKASGVWSVQDVVSSKATLAPDGSLILGSLKHLDFKNGKISKHNLDASNWKEEPTSLLKKGLVKGLIKAAPMLVSQSQLGMEVLAVDPPHLVLSGVVLHKILSTGFGEPYLSQCFKHGLHLRGASIGADQRTCAPTWIPEHCGAEGPDALKEQLQAGAPAARSASRWRLFREMPRHKREVFQVNNQTARESQTPVSASPSRSSRSDYLLEYPAM